MEDRVALARRIIDFGFRASDLGPGLNEAPPAAVLATQPGVHADLLATQHDLGAHWPAGLAPTPTPIVPTPDPGASLPCADYVVITWTVAELAALADVLTPGVIRDAWHRYSKDYDDHYKPLIRITALEVAHPAEHRGRP